MTIASFDVATLGPEIDPKESEALQEAVVDKLLRQAEEVILESALIAPQDPISLFAAVHVLREFPRERRIRIVLHPAFRYWLQAMRRTSQGDYSAQRSFFTPRLLDFVWSEQATLGELTRPWIVETDERGGLRCPSLGRFIELGPSYARHMVRITSGDQGVIIQCEDGLLIRVPLEDLSGPLIEPPPTIEEHGYRITTAPLVADGSVPVSTRDPWLRVKLTGTNQRTDGTEFFGVSNELYPENPSLENLNGALALLKQYWQEQYDDLTKFTRVIVPIVASARMTRPWGVMMGLAPIGEHVHMAFTVSSRQGAIYIGDAPPESTIEMLVHENAHVKLRQIQALDTLLSDPLDESLRIPVPWRPDPRPIPGIFEGVFVISHVAECECRCLQAGGSGVSRERLGKRVHDLRYALNCLEKEARFTEKGLEFFKAIKHWAENLEGHLIHLNYSG